MEPGAAPARASAQPGRDNFEAEEIMELPADHWTVQIIALRDEANLKQYAAQQDLEHLPTARIGSGGQLYHVLLLGFYATRDSAEQAVAEAPPLTGGGDFYIRSLGSLQNAIAAGNEMEQDYSRPGSGYRSNTNLSPVQHFSTR